jgi:hypothetical protein
VNYLFTVKSVRTTQEVLYYLDDETSLPLKIEAYSDARACAEGLPNWRWEAKSFDVVDGFHLPLRSTDSTFVQVANRATDKPKMSIDVTVEQIHLNQPYEARLFWPEIQPGAHVVEAVRDKIYHEPGGADPDAASASAAPIGAERPTDWSVWAA